jgi:hypothetical protein
VQENNIEAKMLNVQGMTNTLKIGAKKPCGKECMILSINADLEYEDGKKVPKTAAGVSSSRTLAHSCTNTVRPGSTIV